MREDVYTNTEHDAGRYERARSEDDYYEHASHGRTAQHAPARILGSDAAVAVGRFRPGGPLGYRAKSLPDGPLRATRAEAEADERAALDDLGLPSPLCPECAQGKPQNCAGQTLDANDDVVTCSGGGSR